MPESNDPSPTPKNEGTIPPSFLHECRQFLHTCNAKLGEINESIREWKDTKEKGTDWVARGLALAALGVAAFAALTLHFKVVEMTQEANPEIHVDRPLTDSELHDRRVRDFLNRNTHGVDDAPDELPGTADGDPSAASGDR